MLRDASIFTDMVLVVCHLCDLFFDLQLPVLDEMVPQVLALQVDHALSKYVPLGRVVITTFKFELLVEVAEVLLELVGIFNISEELGL